MLTVDKLFYIVVFGLQQSWRLEKEMILVPFLEDKTEAEKDLLWPFLF